MPEKAIMTLGNDGYITDPLQTLDYMVAWFFGSDSSQTVHYKGYISSFANIMEKWANDMPGLVINLKKQMTDYLMGRFDDVTMDLGYDESDPASEVTLNMYLSVRDGNNHFNLSHLIRYTNGLMPKLLRLEDNVDI